MAPIENLTSLMYELSTGNIVVRPMHTSLQTNFNGCGSHREFYEGCFSEARKAIPHAYERTSEITGDWRPHQFKYNISVGWLPKDTPAYIQPGSKPDEYNITFNSENEQHFGKYAHEVGTSVFIHEAGVHGPEFSSGKRLSEKTVEKINIASLYDANLGHIAELTKKGSKYLRNEDTKSKLPYIV